MSSGNTSPNELLRQFLDDRERSGFFGQITIKFENGQAVYVREERGWKLEELGELPSSTARHLYGTHK